MPNHVQPQPWEHGVLAEGDEVDPNRLFGPRSFWSARRRKTTRPLSAASLGALGPAASMSAH